MDPNFIELIKIEATLWLERASMLVLSPKLYNPRQITVFPEHRATVIILSPNGERTTATAVIVTTHRSIRGADVPQEPRWPLTMWLTDKRPEEVPEGSKVYLPVQEFEAIWKKSPPANTNPNA